MAQRVETKEVARPAAREISQAEPVRDGPQFLPAVDIFERPEEYVLKADIPGASAESVDIRYENGILTVAAKIPRRQPENASYLIQEFEIGDFSRAFSLGETIDADAIVAECADGVVTVRLPKSPAARSRKIQVKER